MTAMGAKNLLQIIIGAGEIRAAMAVEKPGPITAADLEKVVDGGGQRARFGVVPRHRPEEPSQAPLPHCRTVLVVVVQDMDRPMAPAIGDADGGPESGRCRAALVEKGVEAPERLGHDPLFSPRSRLSEMAVRRAGSVSPDAASGGRPLSVRALRTALQEPRTTSAAWSVRPSNCPSRGRTPRTRFCRIFLAWRSASEIGLAASRRSWP